MGLGPGLGLGLGQGIQLTETQRHLEPQTIRQPRTIGTVTRLGLNHNLEGRVLGQGGPQHLEGLGPTSGVLTIVVADPGQGGVGPHLDALDHHLGAIDPLLGPGHIRQDTEGPIQGGESLIPAVEGRFPTAGGLDLGLTGVLVPIEDLGLHIDLPEGALDQLGDVPGQLGDTLETTGIDVMTAISRTTPHILPVTITIWLIR